MLWGGNLDNQVNGHDRSEAAIVQTTRIAAAYLGNNDVALEQVAQVITEIYQALRRLDLASEALLVASLEPAVPISKSVKPDYLVCLEDGKKFKSLRRHLRTLGMTEQQYREKWNLSDEYPMTAPSYSEKRSKLAKQFGLGQKKAADTVEAEKIAPVSR